MARLSIQEEEKLLVVKYVRNLSPYIHQEMEFLIVSMLADAFHYENKIEAKQKGKIHFANKTTVPTSDKKLSAESNKFDNPSQQNPPNPDHQKKKF